MKQDEKQFDTEKEHQKYLDDLARLRKIREEERKRHQMKESFDKDTFVVPDSFSDDFVLPNTDDGGRKEKKNRPGQSQNQPRKQSKKKKKKFRLVLRSILAIFLVVILGYGAFLAYSFQTKQKGYYTFAVFGVDSRNGKFGKGEALSDVNILVNIDRGTGDIQVVSLYRDTYSKIDDKTYHKLNEAYFKGGVDQTLKTIRENFDINVHDYVVFNWEAVIHAIDILGGVDIDVTDAEFAYINSFITETVESTGIGSVQLQHPGLQHLDGVQAVAYARLRLMDNDFQRTERQRKVISLAFDKAKVADKKKLMQLVVSVLPMTSTNITIDDILPMAKNTKKYHLSETVGFPFDKEIIKLDGRSIVVPITLKSNVIALHQLLFKDESYTPSDSVQKISDYIIKKTGKGTDERSVSDLQENGIEESESTLETSLSPNGQKNSKKMPKSSKTNKSKKAESTVKSKTSAMNSSLPSSEQGAATVAGGEVIQGTVAQSHSGESASASSQQQTYSVAAAPSTQEHHKSTTAPTKANKAKKKSKDDEEKPDYSAYNLHDDDYDAGDVGDEGLEEYLRKQGGDVGDEDSDDDNSLPRMDFDADNGPGSR